MNRRRVTAVPSLLVVALAPLVGLAAAPPAGAVEECRSRTATLVGTPGGTVIGTAGVDVIVTNGATDVDSLGGNDLVCVTSVSGETTVVTGSGNDAVEMLSEAVAYPRASARRAAGAVTVELGEGNDAFYSYALVSDEGVGPGGTVDLGPGSDRATVLVNDSQVGGGSAGTTGELELDGGTGPDEVWFSTYRLVAIVEPGDGRIDIDMAEGTADISGVTQVSYTGFESQEVSSSGHLTINGTDGPDRVIADACGATIKTGPGSDHIELTTDVGAQDTYVCSGRPTRIYSGAHADVVRLAADGVETNRREFVPVVRGGSGADIIEGQTFGASAIRAYGEAGNDRLVGGQDWSDLPGYIEGDLLAGGPGNDVIYGLSGGDSLYGGTGRDTTYGGRDRDLCRAEVTKGCER